MGSEMCIRDSICIPVNDKWFAALTDFAESFKVEAKRPTGKRMRPDVIATVEAATRQNVSPSTWGKVLESYLVGPTRMSIDLASEHDHQRVDLIYRSRLLYAELSGKQLALNDPSLVLDERTYKPDGFANLTKEEKKRILDEADRTEQMLSLIHI